MGQVTLNRVQSTIAPDQCMFQRVSAAQGILVSNKNTAKHAVSDKCDSNEYGNTVSKTGKTISFVEVAKKGSSRTGN